MKLFGQLVRTTVNVVTLPIVIVQDLKDVAIGEGHLAHRTTALLEKLKEEAQEDE